MTTKALNNGTTEQKKPAEGAKGTMVVSRQETEQKGEESKPKEKAPSIENVLAQVYDKYDTAKRLEFLQDTKKDLASFKAGDDNLKTTVTIEDRNGKEFTTSNTMLVTEVLAACKRVVEEKIKTTEAELLTV